MKFLGRRSWKLFLNSYVLAVVCLGAALATGIIGCAISSEEEKVPKVEAVSPAQSQTPAVEKSPQSPAAAKELTLEEQPFRVQELLVHEERGQTIVRVKFTNPVTQYRHFPLIQPARLVLDVFGDVKRLARVENFRVDTQWVGPLRLSSSEGYLRMVMEIAAAAPPPYVIEPENGGLKVIIGPINPAATGKKELQLVQGGKRTDVQVAGARPVSPVAAPRAPAPQALPTGDKKYTGQRISLDFKDADIKNVFRLLAEVSGLNIVVTDDVKRRVTVRLVDVPWDQALDLIIATNGLGKEQVGNVVRISTTTQFERENKELAAKEKAKETSEPLQTAYFNVNYAKVKELEDRIKLVLTPRGKVKHDERSSTVVVVDIQKGIDEAAVLVSKLDIRTPQVLIESNLIETSPSFARALGLELNLTWQALAIQTGFTADSPFKLGVPGTSGTSLIPATPIIPPLGLQITGQQSKFGPFRDVKAILSAAEQEGNIKTISRPSVVTLNNVASTIQSLRILRVVLPTSTNIASGTGSAAGSAVATEQIPVGVILTVTPQVSKDGFILMNIKVKSSTLGSQSPGSVVPDELTREAVANILVRDGETIVIGGIMKDTSATSETGVPWLRDIPVLGWLFKKIRWQKDFEELIVFITPRLLTAGSENLPSAEQLWREQMKKTDGG